LVSRTQNAAHFSAEDAMRDKLLIVGLGNPGKRYADTRHNVGFMVVDELAAREREAFCAGRGDYLLCRLKLASGELFLQKPLTYMNLSGSAVQQALQYFKLTADEMLIVCDDTNLPFGRLRLRAQGSDGGHNGLSSVIAALGTEQVARLRIGVGNDFIKGGQADYVLSTFVSEERQELKHIIERAADAVLFFAEHGITSAMNQYNV
jgi:PTH1 family peptidyl-tRNA hydrolase